MKKQFATLCILALPLFGLAQSKISAEGSFGNLMIGKDRGINYEVGINYHISEDAAIKLSGQSVNMENNDLDVKYDVMKISLGLENTMIATTNLSLSAILGISYISIDDKLPLEKNDFTGLDVGVHFLLQPQKPLSYGVKLVSTYAYQAPGGMLQSNAVVRYRF